MEISDIPCSLPLISSENILAISEEEKFTRAPSNPQVFGPWSWFLLHRAASRTFINFYEFESIISGRKVFGALLSNLYTMIPCVICSKHTASYINTNISKTSPETSKHLINNNSLSKFLYEFHAAVNENYAMTPPNSSSSSNSYVKPSYKTAIKDRYQTEIPHGFSTTLDYDPEYKIIRAAFFFLFNGAAKISPSTPQFSSYNPMTSTYNWIEPAVLDDLVTFFQSCWVLFPINTGARTIVRKAVTEISKTELMEKLAPRTGTFLFVYKLYYDWSIINNTKYATPFKIAARFGINIQSESTIRDNVGL